MQTMQTITWYCADLAMIVLYSVKCRPEKCHYAVHALKFKMQTRLEWLSENKNSIEIPFSYHNIYTLKHMLIANKFEFL